MTDDSGTPRILAAASGDPFDPISWSGTASNLCGALTNLGIDVRGVDPRFGRLERWANLALGATHAVGARRSYGRLEISDLTIVGATGDFLRRSRSRMVDRAVERTAPSAALYFSHAGLSLPKRLAEVTCVEDMTISQILQHPGHFHAWDSYSRRYVQRRASRQAKMLRSVTTAAFLSSWAADAAIADYGLDPEKTVVIGVGSRFRPSEHRRDWSVPKFLFVGLDWRRKNGDQVVAGFARVREQHPSAELHLVGRHPIIDQPGVQNHGYLQQTDPAARAKVETLFATCTCFVLPSTLEPSALSYAEACSQGIPSIGTVHGGSEDIFGDAGIAVVPERSGAVAEAMLRLSDPDVAQRMGAIALRRAPMLTWDQVARRLAIASGWWQGEYLPLTRVTP